MPHGGDIRTGVGPANGAGGAAEAERAGPDHRLLDTQALLAITQRMAHLGTWELELDEAGELGRGAVRWSDEMHRIFGHEPGRARVSAESFLRAVHPADRAAVRRALTETMRRRSPCQIEHRIVRPDGTERVVQQWATVVATGAGGRPRLVGTCHDVTDWRRTQQNLARDRDDLEHLVQQRTAELEASHQKLRMSERMVALGTLSAGLGHDMANLLFPVRVRLDSMQSSELPPGVREDVRAIRKAVEYLQRLASGLRMFALDPEADDGAETGTDLAGWWVDVEPFLRNALPKGVSLSVELTGELPRVRLTRHALTQAVFNLVQNAGHALRGRSDGTVRVWAAPEPESESVRLGVTDNGQGMSAEVRQRCLEPFFTTRTREISTGLGLALVHGIVQRAGGSIEIDSEVGRGSTFVLTLPAIPMPDGCGEARDAAKPLAALSVQDARLRAYTGSLLHLLGFEVRSDSAAPGDGARVWVTEPGRAAEDAARRFVTEESGRWAVVLGGVERGGGEPRLIAFEGRPRLPAIREALQRVAAEVAP